MTEILIAVAALTVGTAVAWLWRGSLAKATLAPLEQQLADKARELDTLKAEHTWTANRSWMPPKEMDRS